jgi:hypothetical protein
MRARDQADADQVLPHLDPDGHGLLARWLPVDHPWRESLTST